MRRRGNHPHRVAPSSAERWSKIIMRPIDNVLLPMQLSRALGRILNHIRYKAPSHHDRRVKDDWRSPVYDPMQIIGWSAGWKGVALRSAMIVALLATPPMTELAWWQLVPRGQSACELRLTITHSPWLKSPRYFLVSSYGWYGLTLTFPQFAALCWCLPILVGAEADFPTPALNTGEAAEEAPEGAEPSSRQIRQSAAPESYSFQVWDLFSFPTLLHILPLARASE